MDKLKQSEKTQAERFIKAAKSIGCDESEEAFNANLKKVASAKPNATASKAQKQARK